MSNSKYEQYIQTNNYTIRTETHQGKAHLVIPVVMMVEGVHNGSEGPLLHTRSELEKFPAAWNGIPVLVGHPLKNGNPISANSPKVIDQDVVGRVYNSKVEDGKLKGEVWVASEKLKQLSPLAYSYIMQMKPLDVSVGVFSDDEETPGKWGEEDYIAIARNYRPDHLALLPGEAGACSWLDGCGVRVNKKSLMDAVSFIRDKLYAEDSASVSYHLKEVYDDGTFIYWKTENGVEKYYKRGYQIKEGIVEFENNITEVTKEVKYKPITQMKRTKFNNIKSGGNEMNKVTKLLTIAPAKYAEADKEWLEKLEDVQIDKLIACAEFGIGESIAKEALETEKANAEVEEVKANAKISSLEAEIIELKKGSPQVNEEAAIKILKEKVSDMSTFASLLPDELKGQFEYGQKLYSGHRTELIAHIVTNQAVQVWTPEKLAGKNTADLQDIADSIKAPVSYEAKSGRPVVNTEEEMLLPPSTM